MFRKLLIVTVMGFEAVTASAQKAVHISGTYAKAGDGLVKLFRTEAGKLVTVATYQAGPDRKFGFTFYPPAEAWYVIGSGNEKTASDNYVFSFKGGEQLNISLTQNGYELKGKVIPKEIGLLYRWRQLSDSVYQKSVNFSRYNSTYIDFFPQLEKLVKDAEAFSRNLDPKDAFSVRLRELIQMDLLHYSNQFLNTPRAKHPALNELSNYYQSLDIGKLTGTAAKFYNYPWGERTLGSLLLTSVRQKGIIPRPGLEGSMAFISLVKNDTLKGDLALERMAGIKSYYEYQQYLEQFGKFLVTPLQERQKLKGLQGLEEVKPGTAGYDFSATDISGKTLRLSDLKGKIVLVDVWATWCGPCKQEEPYWEKLTARYAGKDIVFAGLSTDENKAAWEKYVKEKQLKGLQLHIGNRSGFAAVYKVNSIPRYLLFDKEGKIIAADSPRPSNEALTKLINEQLNK